MSDSASASGGRTSLVSLIMPVWKPRSDWLRQAVASGLDQRGTDVELLVVDDGSPEPVAELIGDIDDQRLRIVRVEHGGAPRARNAGIRAAKGEFVRFIDYDDVIETDSTNRLLRLASGADDTIAYGATMFCTEELIPVWKMVSDLEGDAVTECLLGRFAVRPHALLFPRRVVDQVGGWDPEFPVSEDWDFVLRAVEYAPVRGTDAVATYYRKHGGGKHTDLAKAAIGARRVIDRYFERHPEQRGTRLERRANGLIHAQAARALVTRRQPIAAVPAMTRSLMLAPSATIDQVRLSVPALMGHLRARREGWRHRSP